MKVLVIHNLQSGYQDGSIYDFIRLYGVDGDEITLRILDGKSKIEDLVAGAEEFDFVVACGGDGTVTAISYALRNSDIPILPYPAGTANLLALNLYMPTEPHALCKLVDEANTIDFDLGEIETSGGKFGFAMIAGCGYDELIMRKAAKSKNLLGPVAYFEAAFTNPNPTVSRFHITVDGKAYTATGIGVLLLNFGKIQSGLKISEYNTPLDGQLDVVILKTKSAIELLPTFFAKAVDRPIEEVRKLGALSVLRGKEVIIDADPAMMIQFDGEVTGVSTPFKARCIPGAARFIVSEEASKEYGGI